MVKISTKQYKELQEAYELDDQLFSEKLEQYTGIKSKSYIARNYFDCYGNYVGCSENFDLDDLLEGAFVRVGDD